MTGSVVVLIPAYKPDAKMLPLCRALRGKGLDVLLVDDGGGAQYRPLFDEAEALGCAVVHHAVNLGKGRALKTGLNEALNRYESLAGVVTADADGQHAPEDIVRVRDALLAHPGDLVIGARAFQGEVPLRSRLGNGITRAVYRFVAGRKCADTQTGLRGIPAAAIPAMLRLPGERYEFEMEMLLRLKEMHLGLYEVPIATIYENNNEGSHFDTLRDSARIYGVILKFMLSSLISFVVDYGLYLLLLGGARLPGAASYALARVVSSLLNYTLNRTAVFHGQGGRCAVARYYLLAAYQLGVGAGLVQLLALAGCKESLIKIPVDVALFFISFLIQRDFVFHDVSDGKSDK